MSTETFAEYLAGFVSEDQRSAVARGERDRRRPPAGARVRAHLWLQEHLPPALYEIAMTRGYYGLRDLARGRSRREGTLPDFLIVGAPKCGTTSLFDWLCAHPAVLRPHTGGRPRKELLFFDYEYERGPGWYREHFPSAQERAAFAATHDRAPRSGEATASYFANPWVPARVAAVAPRAKLIVTLRDPVDRTYSAFQMSRREELEPYDCFETALALEQARLAPELERLARNPHYNPPRPPPLGYWSYLHRSRYSEHVERWLAHFAREQILFVKFEDLAADPQRTLDTVHAFLGLDPYRHDHLTALNIGRYSERMSPETRRRLTDYFRPYNARLAELTGIDFGWPM